MHITDTSTIDALSGSSSATFPQKLFSMLQLNIDAGEIIHWLPHGLAFKVIDNEKFSEEVLPKYFKHTKLTSFQRQLNLYGFRRITKGDDHGAYFHPNFQRGRKDLVSHIRRLPVKATHGASADAFAAEGELSASYSGFESSAVDLDLMDEYDQPPKKKASIILRKESCGDAPYFMPLFNPNQAEGEKDVQNQIKCLKSTNSNYDTENNALSQSPTSHLKWPSTEAMPQMSKLSMNIGYARHLANTSAMNHNENQSFPGPSQGPSDPISFASFNLLSKRQAITNRPLSGLPLDSSGNPLSTQQAYYAGVREAQRQPPCQDYPMQSQQLSSMYACAKNSSSINDFKLLMVQSSPTDFSNGNDGSIWQPRLKSVNSASTNTTSISNSAGISHSNSFEDIECYDYDDIPSFDEAMDMMAARIL